MIQRAKVVTVVADSSKFGREALFQVTDWSRVDRLVVDRAPDKVILDALRVHGVELIVAD